jgi:hypothetical protein
MPDITWYGSSAGGIRQYDGLGIGVPGVANKLMMPAAGIIDWGAGDVTLTGGTNTLTFAGGVMVFGSGATDAALKAVGTTLQVRQGDDAAFASLKGANLTAGSGAGTATFFSDSNGTTLANIYPLRWSSTGDATATVDLGLFRTAAGRLEVNNGTSGTFRELRVRDIQFASAYASGVVGVGVANLNVASPYIYIAGESGAGGTPSTTEVTAGSGVVVYTQQTHDGQATKFVIAYNLGGSMRYIVATLDGTTTTWTNSATKP